jgi:hypothetical protein
MLPAIAIVISTLSQTYDVQVDFGVAHRASYLMERASVNKQTHVRDERLQALTDHYEDGLKDGWPEWFVKDESRNAVFEILSGPVADYIEPEVWEYYDVQIGFDINATARINIQVTTELLPNTPEFDAVIQANADQAAADWIANRPFTPLA